MPISIHLDDPNLCRAAINFTAAETGFASRLVEKDYFCTVVLEYLASTQNNLVFKGGTCLSKIHSNFFRLSEDLDFSIPVQPDVTRGARRRLIQPVKDDVARLPDALPGFTVESEMRGFNNSTQYNAILGYESPTTGELERIKLEVGLREDVLGETASRSARTLILNPLTNSELVEGTDVVCLSYKEAMAEKVRAAITRREVAIRDFFDVDHAARSGNLDSESSEFIDLLHRKLDVQGLRPIDLSDKRLDGLRRQLDTELRSVLREDDFNRFDLDRAIDTVQEFIAGLGAQIVRL